MHRQREPERQPARPARQVDRRSRTGSTRRRTGSRRGSRRAGCGRPAPAAGRGRAARSSRTGANSHLCGSTMKLSACSIPANFGAHRGRGERRAAVGAVDVHPQVALASQTSATPARSSMMPRLVVPAVATDREQALVAVCSAIAASSASPVSRPRVVGRDPQHVDVHHLRGGDDRGVGLVGGGDPQPRGALAAALGQVGVAGGHQRRQVADRAARRRSSRRACSGMPGEVGDPAQRLVLGVDRARALQPAAAVDRRGARRPGRTASPARSGRPG